eukprot:2521506-Karenia_brevis.AAC.1
MLSTKRSRSGSTRTRIAFALPTGQLASEIRAQHPDIDVNTCHGAFLFHKDSSEAMAMMTQHDVVI